MQVSCPSCQSTLRLASAPPAGAAVACPKCGTKFRVGSSEAEADEPTPRVRKKKSGRRQESFGGFAVKAGLAVVGLAVVIVLGYIGIRWLSKSSAAAGEFSKTLTSAEGQLRWAANQYMDEIQKDPDKGKVIERSLARVGSVRDWLRKLDVPSDGKPWYDAVERMAQRLEKLFHDLDQLRALPVDEAREKGGPLGMQMQQDIDRLQAEVDAAKKGFNERNGVK